MESRSVLKERIIGAVSVMGSEDMNRLWDFITANFPCRSWEDIEEAEPDEWDLELLESIEEDPDCHEFVSEEEVLSELGLAKDRGGRIVERRNRNL